MYIVVFVTVPNIKTAEKIAKSLVRDKFAACVSIIPSVKSVYRWQGKLYNDRELLLIIKTKKSLFPKLADKVKRLHPYEVPEIIAIPICKGHKPYLKWIGESLTASK